MIMFRLDATSGLPPYLQLVQQVSDAVRMGLLTVGDQLPTVKEVVGSVTINPNTVLKAYRELEHAGIVEGRPGVGTFVKQRPQGPPVSTNVNLVRALGRWVAKARAAGLDGPSIESLMRSAVQAGQDSGVGAA
jgi:GntR family transcriptional regulator